MSEVPVAVETEAKAFKDSTAEVSKLLDISATNDALEQVIAESSQKLATLKTQLNGSMQTNLDELAKCVRLIEDMGSKVDGVRDRFQKVKVNCKESLENLGNNRRIDQLNVARRNIVNVQDTMKYMEELPPRLNALKTRISSDYKQLRMVYDEWLRSYAWLCSINDQLKKKDAGFNSLSREVFLECVDAIESLGKEVDEKLWEHISRCIELSRVDPASLVRALTIIERNQSRKNKAKALADRGEAVPPWILTEREWITECKLKLESAIHMRCDHAYQKGETMKEKLRIGMQLLSDLENVKNHVVQCFPDHYNILQFFIHNYAHVSQTHMEVFYNDPMLEPGDILVLIEWLDSFTEEVETWGGYSVPEFDQAKERLMSKLSTAVKSRLSIWIQKILDRNDPIVEDDSGLLVTPVPDDIFNLLRMQVKLADDHLKESYLVRAIKIFLDSLNVYITHFLKVVGEDAEQYMDRDFCVIINCNTRLREHIESIPDLLTADMNEESRDNLTNVLDVVGQQLIDLSTRAAHTLADTIMADIDGSKVLANTCFNDAWLEDEEPEGVLIMTSTFHDYFQDLKNWIGSKYFFGVIAIDCLQYSVSHYFKAFCGSKKLFDDAMQLGCKIKADYEALLSFFSTENMLNYIRFADRNYRSGDKIAEALLPIRNLEIFFKYPSISIISNGAITPEGYQVVLSLASSKLLTNGVKSLLLARGDFEIDEKAVIISKFSMF